MGALISRIGFRGPFYYNYNKELPRSPILSIKTLILDPESRIQELYTLRLLKPTCTLFGFRV